MTKVWNVNNGGTSKKDKKAKKGKSTGAISQYGAYGTNDSGYYSNSLGSGYWKDGVYHATSTTKWAETNTDWWSKYKSCHTGNTVIMNIGAGSLYAGGWTRGVKPEAGWYVIDLADHYTALSATASGFERTLAAANDGYANQILSMYIKDFGVPEYTQDFWVALASDLKDMMLAGKSILVACDGGHGRTGMVLAIVAHLLGQVDGDDPIKYIRSIYCDGAVETIAQEKYVYEMCGVAEPIHEKNSESDTLCIICGRVELDPKFGDDMEAEVCSDCIKTFSLSENELEGMRKDMAETRAQLASGLTYVDGEVVDDSVVNDDFYGICISCGTNLKIDDNLRDELCTLCNSHAPYSNLPWND